MPFLRPSPWFVFLSLSLVSLAAEPPLRLALSERIVVGVNVNDARAAMAVWGQALVSSSGFHLPADQDWVLPSQAIVNSLRAGKIDLFCITIEELSRVRDAVELDDVIIDDRSSREMLLIVRRDSNFQSLADLRRRSLLIVDSPGTQLADAWLGLELSRAGLPAPAAHFASVSRNSKPAQVVLPVFFHQADAAIVPKDVLATMVDLNPQLGQAFRQLSISPKLISSFFATRRGFPASNRNRLYSYILATRSEPANRQILTLFRSPGYKRCNYSCIQSSIELFENFHRLPSSQKRGKP